MEKDKSLKITQQLHQQLSDRSDLLGMKLHRFCETLLIAGLRLTNEQILEEITKNLTPTPGPRTERPFLSDSSNQP